MSQEVRRRFVRAREARRTEILEDYVELIGDPTAAKGEARGADAQTHDAFVRLTARLTTPDPVA